MPSSPKNPGILHHPRLRSIIFFSLPGFFSKGVSLILVPLYVTHLTVARFGQLELLALAGTFLQYVFHIGWSSAHLRFYREEGILTEDLNRTLLWFRLMVQAVVLLLLFGLDAGRLSGWLAGDSSLGLSLTLVVVLYLLRELLLFYETRYRVLENAARYATANIANGAIQLVAVYYLLVQRGQGIFGIFLGQVIAVAAVLVLLILIDGRWLFRGKYDARILRRCLTFGLPLVPAALATFLIAAADRYMLKWLAVPPRSALAQVGVYSLAFKFVAVMTLLTQGFQLFWSPYVYATYNQPEAPEKFSFVFRIYAALLFMMSLGILALLPMVFHFFPDYYPGMALVPVMLAGFIIYNIGDFFCVGIGIREKTHIRARAGIIVAFTNIGLNLAFIPHWGALGAAVATTLSYLLYAGILMPASHRLFPIGYPFPTWVFPVVWLCLGWPILAWRPDWLAGYVVCGALVFAGLFQRAGGLRMSWLAEGKGD